MSLIHSLSPLQALPSPAGRRVAPAEQVAAFLTRLHDDPLEAGAPAVAAASWPRPFAAQLGGRRIPLPGARPSWLPAEPPVPGSAEWLGELLVTSAGCCRVRYTPAGAQHNSPEHPQPLNPRLTMEVRRAVASGGGMYPAQVYAVSTGNRSLATGVYRFDAARHELVLTAPTPEPGRLAAALSAPGCRGPLTLLVTCRFARSTAKYGNFAYRLASVDTGLVIGRLSAQLAAAGLRARLHLDFDDAAVDRIAGVSGREEGTYAVITIEPPDRADVPPGGKAQPAETAAQPAPQFPLPPDLDAAHQAARATRYQRPSVTPATALTRTAIARRRSDGPLFDGTAATELQVAAVAEGALAGLCSLLADCADADLPALSVGLVVHAVEGMRPGSYLLSRAHARPWPVHHGDTAALLQETLHARNVNLRLAAFTLHVLGQGDPTAGAWGLRGYRVTQVLAGAVTDAVTLAAAAVGLSAHAMLGFRSQEVAAVYATGGGCYRPLVQIPVGHARAGIRLESSVMD